VKPKEVLNHIGQQQYGDGQSQGQPEFAPETVHRMAFVFVVFAVLTASRGMMSMNAVGGSR